jgi:hypothetical protein
MGIAMTEQRRTRVQAAMLATAAMLTVMVLAPNAMAQGTIVVTSIPGEGWFESPDNTAGGPVELVTGPGPGTLGTGSLALSVAANTDFAGVVFPFLPLGVPFEDLTGGAWRTFVTGAAGIPEEAAALKLAGFQTGLSAFTTLVVEVMRNGTVTPNVWQETTLGDTTVVWQTNDDDGFCIQADPCTFAEFKNEYPSGRFTNAQVALGTFAGAIPAFTSYADGVVLTIAGVTDTFDFEVATAATPTPAPPTPAPASPAPATPVATPVASAGGGLPDTSTDLSGPPGYPLGLVLGSLILLLTFAMTVPRLRFSR